MTARPLLATLIGAMIGAAAIAQSEPAPPPATGASPRFEHAPGGGLLCTLATFHIAAAAGRRCFAGQDGPLQTAMADAVTQLEAHAQASGTSRAELDSFARAMAGEQRPGGEGCDGEAAGLYRAVRDSGVEALRTEVERQLARAGPPQWGACR